MTPVQFWVKHWIAQGIEGLHCNRFAQVCILKVRMLGVKVPSAAAAVAANAKFGL